MEIFLLLSFAFCLFLGGGYALRQRQTISAASAAPFVQTQIRQLTNSGKVELAALSADGKLFAYVTNDFGRETLWLRQTDGGNSIELRAAADANYAALVFSIDGGSLYYSLREEAKPDFALFRMPAFGGVQEKIRDRTGNFALAPGGGQIAFGRRDAINKKDELIVADLGGGTEHIAASLPHLSLDFGSISFSPDGLLLAFGDVVLFTDTQ